MREFKQCDEKRQQQVNLRCDSTGTRDVQSVNYCKGHLPAEGKAKQKYTTIQEHP
jgi:hypothetical protein